MVVVLTSGEVYNGGNNDNEGYNGIEGYNGNEENNDREGKHPWLQKRLKHRRTRRKHCVMK
jgi:hypothetical protein